MSDRSNATLVVIGAGTMGAWTALWSARAGVPTVLVDAWGAGHSRATSGDENRIIRSSHGKDEFYAGWARRARTHWIALGEETGEPIFVEAGAVWFAVREEGFESESVETLRRLAIPVERLSPDETRHRWPSLAVDDTAFALFEPEAGLLHARRGIEAVARAFEATGGRFERAAVRPGRAEGDRLIDVVGENGARIAADSFVFACGPWLPRVFPDVIGDLIRVTKQDVFYIGPAGGDHRFDAPGFPCWVDYDASFYGIPAVPGRGFKIAPDRYGPVFDPSSGDRMVDPESLRLARQYLARRVPALASAPVVETRVCQYETTPDTNFLIDRHPAWGNVWLVGGGSGHGFKHGPVIGEHVAGLVTGRGSDAPAPVDGRFRLERPRIPEPGLRTGGDSVAATWQGY